MEATRVTVEAPALGLEPGGRAPIVGAGRDDVLHAHAAGQAVHDADDPRAAVRTRVVPDGLLVDRHEVDDLDRAGGRGEDGPEDVGAVVVALLGPVRAPRPELPVPAVARVEDAAEERWRVEAGQAAPIDAAVDTDQRGAAAVADQPVGPDGEVTAGPAHRLDHGAADPGPPAPTRERVRRARRAPLTVPGSPRRLPRGEARRSRIERRCGRPGRRARPAAARRRHHSPAGPG